MLHAKVRHKTSFSNNFFPFSLPLTISLRLLNARPHPCSSLYRRNASAKLPLLHPCLLLQRYVSYFFFMVYITWLPL